MISVDQMRHEINKAYDGNWTQLYTMGDRQVIAIYSKMLYNNTFNKMRQKKKNEKKDEKRYYQITIFDYAASQGIEV